MDTIGIEMAHSDRASFHDFFPAHVESVLKLVDHLHVRVADDGPLPYLGDPRITWEYQLPPKGRFFDEAHERQELLRYALDSGAQWAVCFDSDEVIHSGWDEMKAFMSRSRSMLWGVSLSYCSHHRHDHVLRTRGFRAWRGFRLTESCKSFRYRGDVDGLHCGSIVPGVADEGDRKILPAKVLHHHACSVDDYLQERAFYSNTTEVQKHGGIEAMYPLCGEPPFYCDRFGKDSEAVPFEEWVA